MTQQKFAFNLLAEFSDDLKAFLSPLLADIKLNVDDNPLADNPTAYRRLVGKLNYLTHTKLDSICCTLFESIYGLTKTNLDGSSKVTLIYIKLNPTQGILMNAKPNYKLTAYCDSN